MEGYIGMDVHAASCTLAVISEKGRMLKDFPVIAPSLIPRKPGERIKTDRRDARKLAELLEGGLLTEVHPPTPEDEAVRDLCRAREDAKEDEVQARHRLGKFLLRRGLRWGEEELGGGAPTAASRLAARTPRRPGDLRGLLHRARSSDGACPPDRARHDGLGSQGTLRDAGLVASLLSWHRHGDGHDAGDRTPRLSTLSSASRADVVSGSHSE